MNHTKSLTDCQVLSADPPKKPSLPLLISCDLPQPPSIPLSPPVPQPEIEVPLPWVSLAFTSLGKKEISQSKSGENRELPAPGEQNETGNLPIERVSEGQRLGNKDLWPISEAQKKSREVFRKHEVVKQWYRMEHCGKHTIPFECDSCGKKPWVTIRCGVRLCQACYWVKFGSKFTEKRKRRYKGLMAEPGKNGQDRLRSIMLPTVNLGRFPSCERFDKEMDRAAKFLGKRYKGWDIAAEVKMTDKGAYLHFHAIVYGSWISQKRLDDDWAEVSKAHNVWIKNVWSPKGALNYIAKYPNKPLTGNVDDEARARYLKMVGKRRRVRSGGVLYGKKIEVESSHRVNVCPWCSGYLKLDYELLQDGQTLIEAKMKGYPSLAEGWRLTENDRASPLPRGNEHWTERELDLVYQIFRDGAGEYREKRRKENPPHRACSYCGLYGCGEFWACGDRLKADQGRAGGNLAEGGVAHVS